jgi:hypothetical protein
MRNDLVKLILQSTDKKKALRDTHLNVKQGPFSFFSKDPAMLIGFLLN